MHQQIDIINSLTDICPMKKKMSALLLAFTFFVCSLNVNSQSCTNLIKDGEEIKIDCGGPSCAECLQFTYNSKCYDSTGEKEITIYFPHDDQYYYSLNGLYNDLEFYPSQNNYLASVLMADATNIEQRIEKKDLDGNIVGVSVIKDEIFSCVKLSELYECPGSDISATATMINCNNDSYMVELNIENGLAPYQIIDTLLVDINGTEYPRYYDAYTDQNINILGPFPADFYFQTKIVDSEGCEIELSLAPDYANCTFEINTGIGNTPSNPVLNALLKMTLHNGKILLNNMGNTLDLNYEVYAINGSLIGGAKNSTIYTGSNQLEIPNMTENGIYLLHYHNETVGGVLKFYFAQ